MVCQNEDIVTFLKPGCHFFVTHGFRTLIELSCGGLFNKHNDNGCLSSSLTISEAVQHRTKLLQAQSLVIKNATIRLVLGTAVGKGWPLRQTNVNNAFLQSSFNRGLYDATTWLCL